MIAFLKELVGGDFCNDNRDGTPADHLMATYSAIP